MHASDHGHRTRIHLTPLTVADCETVVAGVRQAHWAGDYPTDGDRFIAVGTLNRPMSPPPWCHYHVRLDSGLIIGGAGFHGPPINETLEIGYGIVGSQRGRGYASQAVAELLALAEATDAVAIVRATTTPTNRASQRVLERMKFSRIQDEGDEFVYLRSVE
ncbi:GNAT family N-acetyltransferase [Ferrimicrobium acidiphilum]|uniref:GNAT family N-acetyltransferase n=1 Tax=Ferrimicrobium acidiphilum TaxID=121039 RepID=UPI0023F27365|nr:GNAT family N-acetyltransferase [Ferrimicrobium acidiphilum]